MNINRIVLTGNLTADPELRALPSGTSLCRLRIASNTRRKMADGSWGDRANYFDVVVWGAQGETASRYLRRGSGVAVDGRLEWREWSTDSGEKRQAVEIVAESVQFLGGAPGQDAPTPTEDPASAPAPRPGDASDDDDIPF